MFMRKNAGERSAKHHYNRRSKGVNKRGQLTVEKLKCYPCLDTLSDADAAKAIDAITRLTVLLFDLIRKRDPTFDEFNTMDAGK
jgi:hypothetical protein